jgi:hypothetical protein
MLINFFRNSTTPKQAAKRLKGAGRPLTDAEFDAKMINWIREQRKKKLRVSRTMIQRKASELSSNEEFKVINPTQTFIFLGKQWMVGKLLESSQSRISSTYNCLSKAARVLSGQNR